MRAYRQGKTTVSCTGINEWGLGMAQPRRRRRRYEIGQEPWLLREYGGAPMWLICVAAVFLVAVGVLWLIVG